MERKKSTFPYTTVAVSFATKEDLEKLAALKGESFENIIRRLIAFAKEHNFAETHEVLAPIPA